MLHDKLLAKLSGPLPITMTIVGQNKITDALHAVAELHKPVIVLTDVSVCSHCESDKLTDPDGVVCSYPCPTIQAIEKELG